MAIKKERRSARSDLHDCSSWNMSFRPLYLISTDRRQDFVIKKGERSALLAHFGHRTSSEPHKKSAAADRVLAFLSLKLGPFLLHITCHCDHLEGLLRLKLKLISSTSSVNWRASTFIASNADLCSGKKPLIRVGFILSTLERPSFRLKNSE